MINWKLKDEEAMGMVMGCSKLIGQRVRPSAIVNSQDHVDLLVLLGKVRVPQMWPMMLQLAPRELARQLPTLDT